MLDAAGDAKHANYSREDDSARRLWLTQRTRANPWEHRTPSGEDPDPRDALVREIAGRKPELPETMIGQADTLSLAVNEAPPPNPFATLVVNRLGLKRSE